jgi:hypothetical protein
MRFSTPSTPKVKVMKISQVHEEKRRLDEKRKQQEHREF